MRRLLHIIYILMLTALSAGCAKIEQSMDEASNHLIGYEVVENQPVTKAVFPTDQTFMSTAYRLASGRTWDANSAQATQHFNYLQEEVKYQGTYWKTDHDYYWPTDGGSLTFFSYTPKSVGATITKDGVSVNSWDIVDKKGQVILVADIAKDKTKNESYAGFSGVPTLFRHKLSKVSFKVARSSFAEEGISVHIKSIKIADVYTKGNYSRGGYENDSWSGLTNLRTEANPYVIFQSSAAGGDILDETPVMKGDESIMIPQMLNENGYNHPRVFVEYTTTTGGTVEAKSAECFFVENFRSGQWAKGNHYTYTIYIGVGQYPIEFDGMVSDWLSSDMGTTVVQ